ncbi:amino acid permease [Kitasatospora sp. MAA4]|uniref:amino acid permease n=1 Tax=Kitasatospora sp. MAA4 TaxID=3035093 RepID=UPI0024766B24|nr:amino acid permease [Kitasatospora sp. MAA4]
MIGLGGAIGAGLFVGSGAGIAVAGPGIVVSYVLAGLLMLAVMRMLGEMSAAAPSTGTFSLHAERAFGPWAGFTVGWLYWSLLVVVLAIEATGAAGIVHAWIPGVATWVWVLLFMAVLTATNLAAVGAFGEAEFWLAVLKVGAVVGFLVLGSLALFGLLPGTHAVGLSNVTGHGGMLPAGWHGVLTGTLAVLFSFGGAEIVAVAAAESDDPVRGISRSMRSVVWRLMLFYVGSMALIVALLPWNELKVGESPYTAVLDHIGIPAAAQLMNVVVLSALLSALNANLYSASRMVHSLARRGEAPAGLLKVSGRGVPRRAVLASAAFGFVSVLLNLIWPQTVFLWMLDSVGAIGLVVWISVGMSQLRLRARMQRDAERPAVPMWGFPYVTLLALTAMAAVLVLLAADGSTRPEVVGTGLLTAAVLVAAAVRSHFSRRATAAE